MSKTIVDFEVDDCGVDHSQYFTGGGAQGFDDVATGIGDTAREAARDALESLAQNDWSTDLPALREEIAALDDTYTVQDDLRASLGASYDDEYSEDDPTGECYYYVVIRVSGDDGQNSP